MHLDARPSEARKDTGMLLGCRSTNHQTLSKMGANTASAGECDAATRAANSIVPKNDRIFYKLAERPELGTMDMQFGSKIRRMSVQRRVLFADIH